MEEELAEINKIFKKSVGVFAHGLKKKKNIFRVRNFENDLKKYFKTKFVLCVTSDAV